MARVNSQDLIIWSTAFLACLLWSLEYGILLAIGVSACLTLYVSSSTRTLFFFPQRYTFVFEDGLVWMNLPGQDVHSEGMCEACACRKLESSALGTHSFTLAGDRYNESSPTLLRLACEADIGVWVADPKYTTTGLAKSWAPSFVKGSSTTAPLVVKLGGAITFSMANQLRDRLLAIDREYQSEDEVRTREWCHALCLLHPLADPSKANAEL